MRNTYFSNGSQSERALYEDLVIESIQINGYDTYYIPRNVISKDGIFNEDIESVYDASYMIEMYIETLDAFSGDGDLMSKFGLEIRDQAVLVVARRTFERWTKAHPDLTHPREGDLVYLPLTKALFEVTFVENEQPFYQLGSLSVYKLTVEKYEYRGEDIDTGIEEVDDIQSRHSTVTPISIVYDSPEISFEQFEKVGISFNGHTVFAEVLSIDNDDLILRVGQHGSEDGVVYELEGDVTIIGQTTGASASGTIIDTLVDDSYDNDAAADNQEFEEFGNDFIDFGESNPFGEI